MSVDPKHHHESPEDMLASIRLQCQAQGLRLTPIRDQVLSLVINEGKPIKAYDLLERLREGHARAAPPTVYRALDFLLENGFIHRLESRNAFVGCGHPEDTHDSQFLICDRCDATVELEDESVVEQLRAAAEAQGFVADSQTIEVHGVCGDCTTGKTPNQQEN
jgi:Fur family zinc uptake transcriptional regulator